MVQIMSKFTIVLMCSKGSLRNLMISYQVHKKCMSSRIHIMIFTTCQRYLNIETRATAVFASKYVVPRVVCKSRYLNQEKHIGAYVWLYT